jgi:protein-disulfide isomerase/uncharacterized membrane protein
MPDTMRLRDWLGLGLPLAVALAASLMMALAQLETVELPGCGSVSDCSLAAESRWGKLPGTKWPLSFVGFAYFQALAATLLAGGERWPRVLRTVLVVGSGFSLLLVGVMIVEGYLCSYCLAVHTANLAFVACYSWQTRRSLGVSTWFRPRAALFWFVTTLVLTSVLLATVDRGRMLAAETTSRNRLQHAITNAAADAGGNAATALFAPGRYPLGPDSATVHVTVVSDYQCPSCRRIDALLRAMTAGRDDVSISARHFPFCTDCNEHVDKTRHPNACRGAVAAEAAGVAGGTDAFWQMHDWLFKRGGTFTDEDLLQFVAEAGIPVAAFREAMASEETIGLIRSDATAADAAGLKFTPMVFINGVAMDLGK